MPLTCAFPCGAFPCGPNRSVFKPRGPARGSTTSCCRLWSPLSVLSALAGPYSKPSSQEEIAKGGSTPLPPSTSDAVAGAAHGSPRRVDEVGTERPPERIGLGEEERATVYYTALLINVGCHTDAHEPAKWFGDDLAFKATKDDHPSRSVRGLPTGLRFRLPSRSRLSRPCGTDQAGDRCHVCGRRNRACPPPCNFLPWPGGRNPAATHFHSAG
jgi:hypothetical protein